METVSIRNPGMDWDIAANIHFPPGFDAARRYPAIVSNHTIGSCKEQTAGNVYGAALAEAGFVVIVPDASFQGGSGGSPRWLEDAEQRVRDYRDVIDYLQRFPYVVSERIGILGIYGVRRRWLFDQDGHHRQAGQGLGQHHRRQFRPALSRGGQRLQSGRHAGSDGRTTHSRERRR